MKTQELSQSIERLITSLEIEKKLDTSFLNWLSHLCDITHAEHAVLTYSEHNIDSHETWCFGTLLDDMTEHVISDSLAENQIYSLTIYAKKNTQKKEDRPHISILEPTIKMCLKLGFSHHKAYQLDQLGISGLGAFNLGLVRINQSGKILYLNAFANTLFEAKQLNQNHSGVLLLGNKLISSYLKTDLPYRFRWNNGDYHFYLHIHQQINTAQSWADSQKNISIIIQPLRYTPDPLWLMPLLNLNYSQAQVASYACCGLTAKDISKITKFSVNTIYSYLKYIYKILGIKNQSQLASAIWPNVPM